MEEKKYFLPSEFIKFEEMNLFLLEKIELLRKEINEPMRLTASNEKTGHSPKSWHYQGKAVDFVCKADKLLILDKVLKLGFTGVGYYTNNYWHVDIRISPPTYWIGTNKGNDYSKIEYYYYVDKDLFKKDLKKSWNIA